MLVNNSVCFKETNKDACSLGKNGKSLQHLAMQPDHCVSQCEISLIRPEKLQSIVF